ncbi:4Fe-4S dicluster domain-containing protein [Candidatus Endoriftia persephone]|jgi:ferredoxin|uniref:Anaerobic sulfite reductase subunit ArsA n=3 Tax=Gammaproteobacteria TaxID=1236 RepID=G2DGF6_9GAMM|nr:4Fe-4S dicluster domain-containing protein [Candidatus Endoriftia persephone]EGV50288.1 anaerobic sulfite reductase subunit ArsA [endosymbiont of Riftia pachyptila (vent Ph05)]EGW53541.1 putative anaerobic sulfite reductase subunit A [endosymbiont of Tevnia jerichonana (vent Tica)]USF86851.1 4Fe-4S dicluster domain-containing protein [Candidatus Endoriftia persephone]
MEKILSQEKLREWVDTLDDCEVHAPAFADSVWNYARVDAGADIDLSHSNTIRSVKEFAFPQREVFFRFETKDGVPLLTSTLPNPKPTVVFGVRPCDGRGMPRNDTVFSKEFEDPYYWARREKLTLVGLACNEPHSPNCFCQSVGGSPHSEEGLDILMTDLGDRFHVKGITAKGVEIMERGRNTFDEVHDGDLAEVEKVHDASRSHPQRPIGDLDAIPEAIRSHFDSPLWDEMAQHCIGCGICTFLCPTCHCFDINDEVAGPNADKGERVRTWDNCQFPDFTMHTSGHNPRGDLGSRLRQRVSHKFLYFVENHETQQCTGCGRCISECPVGIDIVAVLERVDQA